MKRIKDKLIPIELDILRVARLLQGRGISEFHGHMLARELADRYDARKLVGYGTLYKALDRLEQGGFLESDWENPYIAAEECRPRRRLYRMISDLPADMLTDLRSAIKAIGIRK